MLTLKMTVTFIDGREPKQVVVLPVSQVAFERHFKCSLTVAFNGESSLEHLFFLAWHASRTGMEFDPWLETVEGIDVGTPDAVDPTNPPPSAGP